MKKLNHKNKRGVWMGKCFEGDETCLAYCWHKSMHQIGRFCNKEYLKENVAGCKTCGCGKTFKKSDYYRDGLWRTYE